MPSSYLVYHSFKSLNNNFAGLHANMVLLYVGKGTSSIMKYFHGGDQTNCSTKQVNHTVITEAAPLSPSGTFSYWLLLLVSFYLIFQIVLVRLGILSGIESYSGLHPSEQYIEFRAEEMRIRYAMPSLDQQGSKRELCSREVCICGSLNLVD